MSGTELDPSPGDSDRDRRDPERRDGWRPTTHPRPRYSAGDRSASRHAFHCHQSRARSRGRSRGRTTPPRPAPRPRCLPTTERASHGARLRRSSRSFLRLSAGSSRSSRSRDGSSCRDEPRDHFRNSLEDQEQFRIPMRQKRGDPSGPVLHAMLESGRQHVAQYRRRGHEKSVKNRIKTNQKLRQPRSSTPASSSRPTALSANKRRAPRFGGDVHLARRRARIAHYPPVTSRWESRDCLFLQPRSRTTMTPTSANFHGTYGRDLAQASAKDHPARAAGLE